MSIERILVANRAEIARRVMRTCRELGIATVAVYSDDDAELPYVDEADEAVCLGDPRPSASYLDADRLLDVARATGCDAVHPGYGFLSENAEFAEAVVSAGLRWIGPPPAAIRAMGHKSSARQLAQGLGIPVVPGFDRLGATDEELVAAGAGMGLPLLVKAASGGGGRGMRRVDDLADLPAALASARQEAESAFGDGSLLLERYVDGPRHIEVQVFGDTHGNVVHLGERECSIQRRHQKVVEEAPSPAVDAELRGRLGEAAVTLARAVDYEGAGTVEFLLGADGAFFFLEMNTRLQVEHPVTEEAYGVDLVAWQIAVAEGRPLPRTQDEIVLQAHAIELRVYAEDPSRDWMPASGVLSRVELPAGPGVRIEAGYASGDRVGIHYDSMLAKIVAVGADRAAATRRARLAADLAWCPGVITNLPLLRDTLRTDAWRSGALDTGFFAEVGLPKTPPANLREGALLATAIAAHLDTRDAPFDRFGTGFRLHGPKATTIRWRYLDEEVCLTWAAIGDVISVRGEGEPHAVRVISRDGDRFRIDVDGHRSTVRACWGEGELDDGATVYLHLGHGEAMLTRVPRFPTPAGLDADPGSCTAPTPGVVRAVHATEGQTVARGDLLVTLEAMKMEHTLTAPMDGVVASVRVAAGDAVDQRALLVVLTEPQAT